MPELPEVELVVRDLVKELNHERIERVEISDVVIASKLEGKEAIVKTLDVPTFISEMEGMQIESITRRSKYIYMTLSKNGETYLLASHLGMTGAWFVGNSLDDVTEEKFRRHIHAVFTLDDGRLLIYSDIRRFGELRLLKEEADYPPLLQMAPEPFDEGAEDYFIARVSEPKWLEKPIKQAIMDGTVISGCGNIYATEALFKQKIHPKRACRRISEQRKRALFQEIVAILHESIERGGSSISDYRNVNGESGTMQNVHQMYNKKVCPTCGSATKQIQIQNRTSTYCPQCQK